MGRLKKDVVQTCEIIGRMFVLANDFKFKDMGARFEMDCSIRNRAAGDDVRRVGVDFRTDAFSIEPKLQIGVVAGFRDLDFKAVVVAFLNGNGEFEEVVWLAVPPKDLREAAP